MAGYFVNDAHDYLTRFRVCWKQFEASKSRRLKSFVDLRLAYECALKAVVLLSGEIEEDEAKPWRPVEQLSHDIVELEKRAETHLPFPLPHQGKDLERLKVGLRYTLDARHLLESNQELYYRTVGSEQWLDRLVDQIEMVRSRVQEKLNELSYIVSGDELTETLIDSSRSPRKKFD